MTNDLLSIVAVVLLSAVGVVVFILGGALAMAAAERAWSRFQAWREKGGGDDE